jgi:hypothetical protein
LVVLTILKNINRLCYGKSKMFEPTNQNKCGVGLDKYRCKPLLRFFKLVYPGSFPQFLFFWVNVHELTKLK